MAFLPYSAQNRQFKISPTAFLDRIAKYGTAQMQLHARTRVLLCQHTCVNMLPVTCDGVLASLIYCTRVLHKGLHTRMCYSSGYSRVCVTRVYNCTCNTSAVR